MKLCRLDTLLLKRIQVWNFTDWIFNRRENLLDSPKLLVPVISADTMELGAFIHSAYVPSVTFERQISSSF